MIDLDAIDRIKAAVRRELVVAHPRGHDRAEFAQILQQRLDATFPQGEAGQRAPGDVDVDARQATLDRQG